jgi:hypothetical protein
MDGETRICSRILVWKSLGKLLLGRPRRKWKDDIKIDLKVIGCEDER